MSRKMLLLSSVVFGVFVGLPIWLCQFQLAFRKWRARLDDSKADFLISTDQGIYVLSEPYSTTDLRRLLPGHTFGLARGSDGEVFLSISVLGFSYVLVVDPRPLMPDFPTVLLSQWTNSQAGRVHQLDYFQGVLYIASTMTNSVIAIDVSSHEVVDEFPCAEDIARRPIRGDHNHVNSVYALADACLFVLHTWTERTSAIGIKTKQGIRLYELGPAGSHDVVVMESGTVWSNSFGRDPHGRMTSEPLATVQRLEMSGNHAWISPPTYFCRGVARNDQVLVVGGSHNAKRSERFSGRAELFVYRELDSQPNSQRAPQRLQCHFSQVYQICTESGARFWGECREAKSAALTNILETTLGSPVMTIPASSVGSSQ